MIGKRTLSPRRLAALCAGAAAALMLAGCATRDAAAPPCGPGSPELVCLPQGALRGVIEQGTVAFKGIPYAQPPVGPLRWQAPQARRPWPGVRDATRFSAVCPQLAGQEVIGEEDCLTLNIWRPLRAADPLPVMVFLTGGGNHAFSGQGAPAFGGVNYNGQRLAPEGVLFVSFNNRLGALGFLAHPALGAGNYGSLDQIALLRWLQAHVAAFGGDPKRIMLFGTSAGGASICALMTAPAARGLFHAAALQSNVPTGCEMQTLADAQAGSGRRVAEALGCTGADAGACLRGKSTAEIVRAVPGTFGLFPRLYGPNVDGVVFPEQPLAVIRRGAHAGMPVIVGSSTQETMLFAGSVGPVPDAAALDAALARLFGAEAVPRIRAAYPLQRFATPREALVHLSTDAFFTCPNLRIARTLARAQRQPVYRYLFDHALHNDPELKAHGAVHTIEHVYFFPWQGRYRPTAEDRALQDLMVGHWTAMARSGRAGPGWPAAADGDAYLRLAPQPAAQTGDGGAQCAFWDGVALPWPHL